MKQTLRKYLFSLGAIVMLFVFGFTAAHAQSDVLGPFTADDSTAVLLHFDGNFDIEHGSSLAAPDSAIGYDAGGLTFESGPMSGFGQAVNMDNPPSDVNNDNENFDFVAIPHYQGNFYPDTAIYWEDESEIADPGSHFEAQSIKGNYTVDMWLKVDAYHNQAMQIYTKPGDGTDRTNNWAWDNYEGRIRPSNSGLGSFDGGWFPADGPGTGGFPGNEPNSIKDNFVETESFMPAGKWVKYTFIKDTTVHKAILMAHDVNGNMLASKVRTIPDDTTKVSFDKIHNDIFLGWQPVWNIGTNYPASINGTLGDPSGLGGLGMREMNGSVDEFRLSRIARNYGQNWVFLQPDSGMMSKPEIISASRDSLTFGINAYTYNSSGGSPTVTLHYNAGGGWQTTPMTNVGERHYTVTIENFSGGSDVRYYASASHDGASTTYPGNASDGTNNLSFFVQYLDQRVAKLSFESGSGAPMDSSSFNHTVEVIGSESYSSTGYEGDMSYELSASNYLAIRDAASLNSDAITLDLWFQPSSMPSDSARLIARELDSDSSMVTYSIFFKDSTLHARSSGAGDVELDTKVMANNWYRVVYMISPTAHSIQLWNESGELLDNDVEKLHGLPMTGSGSLFIGQGNFYPDSAFNGLVDAVAIHNYAAKTGPFIVENVTRIHSAPDTLNQFPVDADIYHGGGGDINAKLHYRGGFGWTSLNLRQSTTNPSDWGRFVPAQDPMTLVPYFVRVEQGPYTVELPQGAGATTDSTNYSFGVYKTNTKVLDMEFENYDDGAPVDSSDYHEFADVSIVSETGRQPSVSLDAAQGETAMEFSREDTSYVAVDSKFLNTDEITISFWFKPTGFDPEFDGGWQYYRSIYMVTKNTGGFWHVDAAYGVGINNESYSGEPRTMVGRVMTENSATRDVHDGLDMDSTLQTGKWYHAVFEYNRNDTAYTQLRNSDNEVIEEVGMDTPDFGSVLKNDLPLTIGSHWTGPGQGTFKQNFFSGIIDDVEIYNYAAITKEPSVDQVMAAADTVKPGSSSKTVEAELSGNGNEPAKLWYRTFSDTDTTDYTTVNMEANFAGTYSAKLPVPSESGMSVQYWIEANNDYGDTSFDGPYWMMTKPQVDNVNMMTTLDLQFESGQGAVVDSSAYGWNVIKKGYGGVPTYSNDAHWGDQSMMFSAQDTSFLEIRAPYPFLNEKSFTIEVWFKSMHDTTYTNSGARLINKQGGAGTGPWWEGNFEMKGIGCNSWTFGGHIEADLGGYGKQFIVNYLDDPEHFGYTGDCQGAPPLKSNTWYKARYVQDVQKDSIYAAFIDTAGAIVAHTSMAIPGEEKLWPKFTRGPFRIGRAGGLPQDPGQKNFHGLVDRVWVRNYAISNPFVDIPSGTQRDLPQKFSLGNNYPNPFNPTTTIKYALPKNTDVTLKVYNLLGREVATLVNGKKQAGRHQVKFDAGNLASGVYFYRIHTPEFTKVRKMMLIK